MLTLKKSLIGRLKKHKACVAGLGLRRIRHSVIVEDTPSIRGMIEKVSYLLEVEELEAKRAVEFVWDSLSSDEGQYMQTIIEELVEIDWAKPLLRRLDEEGGLRKENKWLLFELRFGYELNRVGIRPEYEVPGEGDSTVDFCFENKDQHWFVELMRLEETDAAKRATSIIEMDDGVELSQRALSSTAQDKTQSEEGELLKAVERLCQKCESRGNPHKFREPVDGAYNVLLVDFRSFIEGMGDMSDMVHIALGAKHVPQFAKRYWNNIPVTGAYDEQTTLRGSRYLRQRVHFIGFVKETEYTPGSLPSATHLIPNPLMFEDEAGVNGVLPGWPFELTKVINPFRSA